jgi:hypothetical protein
MGSVRNWAAGSAIPTLILLSPVGAFFIILTAEVLIDGLMEAGVAEVCAIGVVGCVLFHRILRSEIAQLSEAKEVWGAPPIAAPPG